MAVVVVAEVLAAAAAKDLVVACAEAGRAATVLEGVVRDAAAAGCACVSWARALLPRLKAPSASSVQERATNPERGLPYLHCRGSSTNLCTAGESREW